MVVIKMTKKHESGLLLGELTNGMWITQSGLTIYKNTLSNLGVSGLENYSGSEKIELEDALFNELTADYFRLMKQPEVI